jgi:hypothetical protein
VELKKYTAMDPSWSEIKHILRRHEDIFEGSIIQIGEFATKFNNIEQMVNSLFHVTKTLEQERQRICALKKMVEILLQRMYTMEHECNHSRVREEERQRINELEHIVVRLFQCMDTLEQRCNQLRERAIPSHSNSRSNNQIIRNSRAGQSSKNQEGWEAKPMETEDNAPSQVEIQEEIENESTS